MIIAVIVGCGGDNAPDPAQESRESPNMKRVINTFLTHPANNYFLGAGRMPSEPLRIDLSTLIAEPNWLIASKDAEAEMVWAAVGADGSGSKFRIADNLLSQVESTPPMDEDLLALPVLVRGEDDEYELRRSAVTGSTAPALASTMEKFENVPDGSTVLGGNSLLYSYSNPTERYPHGALGDPVEWSGLVAGPVDYVREVDRIRLADDEVFEGLFPLVADLDGDGRDEIVTTVSGQDTGARLVVFRYDDDGLRRIASSAPIGSRNRWLHQIAVAPFGPEGEIEIAVVRTPHIGGIAQFYRLEGDRFDLVASAAGGYMSHVNGSRNLDQAVSGDFDGDGMIELLVPSRDQQSLIALRRIGDTVEEVWELELGSRLATNLVAAESIDGVLILAAVTEDNELLIWG